MSYSATGLSWVQTPTPSSSVVCCYREVAYAGHSLQSWR